MKDWTFLMQGTHGYIETNKNWDRNALMTRHCSKAWTCFIRFMCWLWDQFRKIKIGVNMRFYFHFFPPLLRMGTHLVLSSEHELTIHDSCFQFSSIVSTYVIIWSDELCILNMMIFTLWKKTRGPHSQQWKWVWHSSSQNHANLPTWNARIQILCKMAVMAPR